MESEENWETVSLTDLKPEKRELVGKKNTPVMEVQVETHAKEEEKKSEPVREPLRAPKAEEKKPENGDAPLRIALRYGEFKEIIGLLNAVKNEVKLNFGPEGMEAKAIDPAHVGMIEIRIPREAFSEYYLQGNLATWTLDIDRLKKIIPQGSKDDIIELEGGESRLVMTVGPSKTYYELLDSQSVTVPHLPVIMTDSSFVMNASTFRNVLKAAEHVSDAIRFTLNKDGLKMLAFSDGEESESRFTKDMLKEIVCNEQTRAAYPLDYLLKLAMAMKTVDEIKFQFRSDYPAVIDFSVESLNRMSRDHRTEVKYLLAPRMEQ
ncbi:pcn_1 [Thermoplasmatales archaeon]|nr:pcn_1 [Thermoplasmatales archaeon]